MKSLIAKLRWLADRPDLTPHIFQVREGLTEAANRLEVLEDAKPRGALTGKICDECDGYGYHASHSDVCNVCGGFGNVMVQGGQTRKAKHVQAREGA